MIRLDALIRQSQASEAGRSPEQQREAIESWATRDGATIVAEHVGRGRSGKSMDRLDIGAALGRIRAAETDGVVVAWLNRLSRAPVEDALRAIREIREAGGRVASVDHGGVIEDDPFGEMALTIDLANARRQWRETAERYEMNRREAIAAGKHIGKPPFGYRFADPTPKRGARGVVDSHLVADEHEKAVVHELFERKVGGATWLELARWLDGVAPRPNGWARSTVRAMIHNPTYRGEVYSGPHRNPGAHEPLVTPALWRRAQSPPGRRTPRGGYLLTGMAQCEACGRTLRGGGKRTYSCVNRACKARPTVMAHLLDAEVVEQFFGHVGEVRMQAVDDDELADARDAVGEHTEKVKALAAVVPSHAAAVAAHQEALDAAEAELAQAEDRLDELAAAAVASGPDVRELAADWADMGLEDRREHLRAAVEAVFVSRAPAPTAKVPTVERVRVEFR